MTRLSDDELNFWATNDGRDQASRYTKVLAKELLLARKVIEAARELKRFVAEEDTREGISFPELEVYRMLELYESEFGGE